MTVHRSRLVRVFRALTNPQRPKSLCIPVPELVAQTRSEIGILPVDDCHSILVAIAKVLKSTDRRNRLDHHLLQNRIPHPVVVAPLASELIKRIIASDSSFRTVAGTFGLVHRLGIDWSIHLPVDEREGLHQYILTQFPPFIERHLLNETKVDLAAIGYCCETATALGISCPEFYEYVENVVVSTTDHVPPLTVVQLLAFLTCGEQQNSTALGLLMDRVAVHPMSYTPQNLVKVLSAMSATGHRDHNLLDSICVNLTQNASRMRMSDCVSVLQSISVLVDSNVESLGLFSRAMQRRCTILTITSRSPLPVSTAYSIMSSFQKIAMITGVTPRPALQFNNQSMKFLGV